MSLFAIFWLARIFDLQPNLVVALSSTTASSEAMLGEGSGTIRELSLTFGSA